MSLPGWPPERQVGAVEHDAGRRACGRLGDLEATLLQESVRAAAGSDCQ